MIYYAIIGLAAWYYIFKSESKDKTLRQYWNEDPIHVIAVAILFMALWPLLLMGYLMPNEKEDEE